MAPQISPSAVSGLRAASFRLTSASTKQLPHVAGLVAQSLWQCKDVLTVSDSTIRKDSDAGVVLHRFNTTISSFLQGRTVEERLAATILIKAAIESGGWEVLSKSGPWVRGLLANLKKPDPCATRCLSIIALTRIFMLTWDYPTLVREISTPVLPAFLSTCIGFAVLPVNGEAEVKVILDSFVHLLPRHPNIFRSLQVQLLQLLQTAQAHFNSPSIKDLADDLTVLLHQCEPKQGASEKWATSLLATVRASHAASDRLFIAVDESWQSTSNIESEKYSLRKTDERGQHSGSDIPVTASVYSSSETLINTLLLLKKYTTVSTSAAVTAPFGTIVDLLARLFSVAAPSEPSQNTIRFYPGTSKDERDALTEVLPQIHVEAMEVMSSIIDRYGDSIQSSVQTFLDQIVWLSQTGAGNPNVRTAVYCVLQQILGLIGPSLDKDAIRQLKSVIKACCNDILPDQSPRTAQGISGGKPNGTSGKEMNGNADSFLKAKLTSLATTAETSFSGLHNAALALLPVLLSTLSSVSIPRESRILMDRTAVLARHKNALIASVLNPPAKEAGSNRGSSLLPLLAREYPYDAEVEALLRPRMPILQTGRRVREGEAEDDDDDDDDSEEDEEDSDKDLSEDAADLDTHKALVDSTVGEAQIRHQPSADRPAEIAEQPLASVSELDRRTDKRQHAQSQDGPEPKRQRASHFAQSLLESTAGNLAGSSSAPSELPRTIALDEGRSQQGGPKMETLPAGAKVNSVEQPRVEEEDSDDDNFVIPTLDLRDSSDDEEDDE